MQKTLLGRFSISSAWLISSSCHKLHLIANLYCTTKQRTSRLLPPESLSLSKSLPIVQCCGNRQRRTDTVGDSRDKRTSGQTHTNTHLDRQTGHQSTNVRKPQLASLRYSQKELQVITPARCVINALHVGCCLSYL